MYLGGCVYIVEWAQTEVEEDRGSITVLLCIIIQIVLLGVFTWCMQIKALNWGQQRPAVAY